MNEIWKLIHDDFYEVSDFGNLRRAKPGISTYVGRPVNPIFSATGYAQVCLCGGKQRKAYVHHLVIDAFIGPRPPGMVINHKDGNKLNNAIANLEYVTPAQNAAHALKTIGRNRGPSMSKAPPKGPQVGDKHWTRRMPDRIARAERMPHSKMNADKVTQCRLRAANGEKQSALAAEFGVSVAQMSRIIRGTRWTTV